MQKFHTFQITYFRSSISVHSIRQSEDQTVAISTHTLHSPVKPVNLLPEVPEMRSSGRNLSEREKRDCEVIGKNINFHFVATFIIDLQSVF